MLDGMGGIKSELLGGMGGHSFTTVYSLELHTGEMPSTAPAKRGMKSWCIKAAASLGSS